MSSIGSSTLEQLTKLGGGSKEGRGAAGERRPISVFISYRREDADSDAWSLWEALKDRFGENRVFIDVHQEPGDFVENIKEAIKRADVVVSIIGKRWVELRKSPDDADADDADDSSGEDDVRWHKTDFVRFELRLALERKTELVPVFVEGVKEPPSEAELPEDLHPLRTKNGYILVPSDFGADNHTQSLALICNMVELAAHRGPERKLKERVERLTRITREQIDEGLGEAARAALARASAAAEEIHDELLKEAALEEVEAERKALEKLGISTRGDRDRELLGQVGRTVADSRELAEAGKADQARRSLAGAEEIANRIEDDELQKEAFSEMAEVERMVAAGEGRIRELVERGRRQAQAGDVEEAGATLAFAEETARAIMSEQVRERALSEVATLAAEVRPLEGAAERGDFAAAEEISGSRGTLSGSNSGARKEPGEPEHAGNAGGKSVWYQWTAPDGGTVKIDTFGSDFDTLLAVYRGASLADLELIAANDDAEGSQSRVRFPVSEGAEYRIAVDGYAGESGAIVLNWDLQGQPANDHFDAAQELTGSHGTVSGHNSDARREPGEPEHAGNAGGASVWYRWTAPEEGTATIDTSGSDFDTLLAVYRGSSLAGLEPVAANDDADGLQSRVRFPVREGEEYRIAVDGYGSAAGEISLNWEVRAAVPLVDLVRATGLQFTELAGGRLAVPFSGERADRIVANAAELDSGLLLFFVDLPEFSGFGMRTFLRTMLEISYTADYVKAVRKPDDRHALAVEADADVLTPSVCAGLIRGLVELGDVKGQADLISTSWNKRIESCRRAQGSQIEIDPDLARAEVQAMLAGAALPVDLSVHANERAISLIGSVQDLKPGRSKDKLRGLLGLNAGADVAKVGLDSNGNVKLLYEVPQVTPDLVERAGPRLASLQVAVRAVLS